MATYNGTSGDDNFPGTDDDDDFLFNPTDLSDSDVLSGGDDGFDTLRFLSPGTISASVLIGVSDIDSIELADGGVNSLTLDDDFVLANLPPDCGCGGGLQLIGGTGDDTIDASDVWLGYFPGSLLYFAPGSGDDTVLGSDDFDHFAFAIADLTSADTVSGNYGLDTLEFTTAGTISAAALAGVTSVELILLADGDNSITLNDDMDPDGFFVAIDSSLGTGDDTIDASAVDYYAILTDTGGGDDTVIGGGWDDAFTFTAGEFDSGDAVDGNDGFDSLYFFDAGTIGAADMAQVSDIELIQLGGPTFSLTLDDAVAAANAATLLIFSDTVGSETVDASAVTLTDRAIDVTSYNGNDTLKGGAGNDVFRFKPSALTAADTVQGNGGTDTLYFRFAGSVSAAGLANVSGIEVIQLYTGINSVTLNDAVAAANAAVLRIVGGGSNDTVDASAVTLSNRAIDVSASAGADTFRGGAGNDLFRFKAHALTAADIVQGNGGSDTLIFTTAGSVTAAALGGVGGIEVIQLYTGVNSLTLDDAVAGVNAPVLRIVGSGGSDTVDASAVTLTDRAIDASASAGNDTFRGGAGDDIFRFKTTALTGADVVQGNGGTDTLIFTTAGFITAAALATVSGIEVIELFDGINRITLDDSGLQDVAGSILHIHGGNSRDVIDASLATLAGRGLDVTAGDGTDAVKGGGGADTISGGNGNDTLSGGGGEDGFLFDAPLGAGNIDIITDFTVIDDAILLDQAIFSAFAGTGTISANSFVAGASAIDGDDHILFDSATGRIYYDSDGNGAEAAVQFAKVTPGLALTYLDFVVI